MTQTRLCAFLATLLALGTPLAADEGPPKVDLNRFAIQSLSVQPKQIELKHRYDYRQLLVTGHTAAGETVDLTRAVTVELSKPILAIDEHRLARAEQDGQANLQLSYQDLSLQVPVKVSGSQAKYEPSFVQDIMPILAKQGCNSGTCHGSQDGQAGFKLSLRGYDPLFDHQSLTDDLAGRRFNRSAPDTSLMLMKPAGVVPHQGGVLMEPGDPHYQILRDWIAKGVQLDLETPRVSRIEIHPQDPQLPLPGMKQQMAVIAFYQDGSQRDVTAETFIETSSIDTIEMDDRGLAFALRRGEAAVLARYEGAYAATTITVMGDRSGYEWQEVPTNNFIDELVYAKLKRVKLLPSELCTDAEFIRRVYLDLTGLPPNPDQVRAFLDDSRDSKTKRDELVEKLVGSPEYVNYWTYKWCDLLQVNRKYLGLKGVWATRNWIRQAIQNNKPYNEFVYEILDGSGSSLKNPSAAYFKIHREPGEAVENTTQLFLGVRFNCNKCHDHPFERWTQDQYYEMAAYFAQIGRKQGAEAVAKRKTGQRVSGTAEEIIFDRNGGEVTHARTGEVTPPKFPYQAELVPTEGSRREQLARWMTSPDNQYFASSFVNRMWSYLLGRGIIEPVDDIRAGNPPTNPELLDRLTEEFIASGFDVQRLHKLICKSRVYQHSLQTNRWNHDDEINFSHATARRLPAEVLMDTIYHAVDAPIDYSGVPRDFRALQLPDPAVKVKGGFLDLFGRPPRESPCECERSSGMQLSQALNLVNGPVVGDAIAAGNNRIARVVKESQDDAKVVEELFLAILCRFPTDEETQLGVQAIQEGKDRLAGAQDLAWALLNSPAFLFNR